MGTEFGLYHSSSRTFIWLGKVVGDERYQTPVEVIVGFMANQQAGEFRILPDSGRLPNEEEEGWTEIGSYPWPDDDEEEHAVSEGLVAFYSPLLKPIKGCVNEVRIHGHALTADAVRRLYLA